MPPGTRVPAYFPRCRTCVVSRGAHDDASDVVGDVSAVELGEEPGRGGKSLVLDHGLPGVVEDGPVLRDHGVEELEVAADTDDLEERPTCYEDQREARLARPSQGRLGRRTEHVPPGERAVVVAGQRPEDHRSDPGTMAPREASADPTPGAGALASRPALHRSGRPGPPPEAVKTPGS